MIAPRTTPMSRSRHRMRQPAPTPVVSDAVQQAPVRPEGFLGYRRQALLVAVRCQLLDQLTGLGRMLDVARLMDVEVGRGGPVREAIGAQKALQLGLGDLRLTALD